MPAATRFPTPPVQDDDEPTGPQGRHSMNDDSHARRRRQLLEDLKILSSMGLNKELQLPQLVVIGSQSAGKSSLIESLCKITLPRSSGTCTRCPVECRSKYVDEPWLGRVFLRFDAGPGEGSADLQEITFGPDMTDPAELETRIAQAQLAVLCPNEDPSRFLSIDPNKFKATQGFTDSSIVVDVSGREQADLNFVDLPGLIVSVGEGGNTSHIPQVERMIRNYISKSNTIILLVVACSSDYETQGAAALAAEFDPRGERTVGVLTKVDRIESPEDAAQWTSMIRNRVNRLANGWYAVRQADSRQRKSGLSWDEVRDMEAEFFQTSDIWASMAPEHRARLGSGNLSYQLGSVLSKALEARFVELRVEIDRIMREIAAKLRQYPNPSSAPPSEFIQNLLGEFFTDIRIEMIEGQASAEMAGVIQSLRQLALVFRDRLQHVVPMFMPHNKLNPQPDQNFLHQTETWLVNSPYGTRYTVQSVEDKCRGAVLRETDDFGSFDPTRFYMEQVSKEWGVYAQDLLDESFNVLNEKLGELISRHFSKYSHGGLYGKVGDLAFELLEECKQKAETQLMYLAAQEAYPRTFHHELYAERKRAYQSYFEPYGASEAALITMARTLALFEFAYRRYADMVPLGIDLHFVNGFGKLVAGRVTTQLNLLRDEAELAELLKVADPVVAQRDALLDKLERLKAAKMRLSSW
ncbi:myxovirus resistance protein [Ceratobasidium sp. AG-Ba]|nr:myxovirus resistance protein [Ceratobasidium sp. AG-Ba]QRV99316.1 myxovirus resistance protein [Ceratobasidium sp. AG-Ba]QRW13818.1 myxovirus resistance protein [Ceratobasidium sp. AG-Ba]